MKNKRWQIAQWFEIRWWSWYLKAKSVEDYLTAKKTYWRSFLATWGLQLEAGARVLDAGCGPSGIYMCLEDQTVTAIDPLIPAYRKLDHFEPDWYPWTTFSPEPLETFSESQEYDLVFCLNVINHVSDLRRSIHTLFTALKPGGQCLVSVDVHRWRLLEPVFRAIPGDILHPHQFGEKGYRKFLAEAGFKDIKAQKHKSDMIFHYVSFLAKKSEI